jgi:hypothetical protein
MDEFSILSFFYSKVPPEQQTIILAGIVVPFFLWTSITQLNLPLLAPVE